MVGDSIFKYQHLSNNINLSEINKSLRVIRPDFPTLNNNDVTMLRSGGGTLIYHQLAFYTYLIDLDFTFEDDQYKVFSGYLYDKFDSYRKSIKRDMKLNNIIGN